MVKLPKKMTPRNAFYKAIGPSCKWTPEQMASLIDVFKDSRYAIEFALHNRRQFPEGEAVIATSPFHSYLYAAKVLKTHFEKGEAVIAKDASLSLQYATFALGGSRFPAGEPAIAMDAEAAVGYVERVLKKDFPEAEPAIAKNARASLAYAEALGKPFPAGEAEIAKFSYTSLIYAISVLKSRFALGEAAIFKDIDHALVYAIGFGIKDLPSKTVAKIARKGCYAYLYATMVIEGRFKAGENAMSKESKSDKSFYMYHRYLETGGTDTLEVRHRLTTLFDMIDGGEELRIPKCHDLELIIATSAIESCAYAVEAIGRFELGEPAMKKVPSLWKKYQEMLKEWEEKENKLSENDDDEYQLEPDECDDGDEE